jgi:phage major head subunit gpT-like protein
MSDVSSDTAKYMELDSNIPMLGRMFPSDSAYEEFLTAGQLQDLPAYNGQLVTLGRELGYVSRIEPKEFAGQVVIERKFIDDKKWSVFDDTAKELTESAYRVRDKMFDNLFINATSVAFDFQITEEGKAWASATHTTRYQNVSTAVGFQNAFSLTLNKANLAAARLAKRKFRTDAGNRANFSTNLGLIVSEDLEEIAYEIVNTDRGFDAATGQGRENFQRGQFKIIVMPRLTDASPNSWGLVDLDTIKSDVVVIDRKKPEIATNWDFSTMSSQTSCYTRFGIGQLGWRSLLWNQV